MTPALGEPPNKNARRQPGVGQSRNTTTELYFPSLASVKPTFPERRFLPGRVLGILLTGRRYTHKDSWIELGHSRLSDSIWKLRHRFGWDIEMDEEVVATSDAGRQAEIGIYYLSPEAIEAAGERGRQYAAECASAEAERRAP